MVNLLLAIIYLAFISLGLPDGLLGAAWPTMSADIHAPLSWAGGISMVISAGTVCSALLSDRLTLRFGAGRVTAVSVAMTAAALFGFSFAPNYGVLVLMAIPYGLGAGGVDAALNNYVAVHYTSRHMSWLHCMWGLGATLGPYIMGYALTVGAGWQGGYRCIAVLQAGLTLLIVLTLSQWRTGVQAAGDAPAPRALSLREIVRIPGARAVMLTFFSYCAVEQTAGLWASSYLVLVKGVPAQTAASFAGLFFIGITVGRGLNGFLTLKLSGRQLVRLGQAIIAVGIAAFLLPLGAGASLAGLILIGLGCAPIYPCVIHSTPDHFGPERSQALIGVQMASAYVGVCVMPPLFGVIASRFSAALLPPYLLAVLALMVLTHERLLRVSRSSQTK